MRNAFLALAVAVLGVAQPGLGRGLIAEGGGFVLGPDDLRYEVRKLGPSYDYEETYAGRKALVDHLTSRFFLAESALANGYGDEGLAEREATAETEALSQSYRTWKLEKAIRAPRAESRQVLAKLDRKLHVKDMLFADFDDAVRALDRIRGGEPFEQVIASLAGAPGFVVQDPGWRVWREFERSAAVQVFDLLPGQTTGVLRSAQGHAIYGLAEDEPWGEARDELIYERSRRFVRWLREAEAAAMVREELSRRFAVRYDPDGVHTLGEALKGSLARQMPSEAQLNRWVLRYDGRDGEVVLDGSYFFACFWAMQELSRPYIGDAHAVEQFALDVVLPELEAAAGHELGLGRLRDVQWSVRQAREEYLIPKMEELLVGEVQLAPGEAEGYYQANPADFRSKLEYRMRRILVQSPADAQNVLAELRAGGDFAQIASERSLDTTTGPRGGDLGIVRAGMFMYYDSLAFNLNPGEISEPRTLSDGVEILKVEDRSMPRQLTFDEARPQVERVALESKRNKVLHEWIDSCKRACNFRVDEDLLAAVDLPLPDWTSRVAKESPIDQRGATQLTPDGAAEDGGDTKAQTPPVPKQKKKRMIQRRG